MNPAFVTGAAAAALQADGRFALSPAVVSPPGQLNADQAKAVAVRYVREVAPFLLNSWIAAHGSPIAPATLSACDRALYAASPYAPLPTTVSELSVRKFGPHWIVPLCPPAGPPQVVVSFSALATEVAADLNASTSVLRIARADLLTFGLPRGTVGGMYSPESVASYAFTKTGQRVSSVPELVMTPMPQVPALARWSLSIEGSVTLKGSESGASRQRSSLMIGFTDRFTESGLLDRNPSAAAKLLSWTDPVTKVTFTPVLLSSAPVDVELVTREKP
ncbi:MAG: hypothetical protein IT359_05385 [Gemmatimonadaceae bacterium]|nr:hypothetical protein [Gemmatimonadaceae bacterium]